MGETTKEVSDPSDWTDTPLSCFSSVDALCRCQICKDYYTNAVMTTCAHSFCSLCIRRSLTAEGVCPTCRSREQEVHLKRNVALQEITDAFIKAREPALAFARQPAPVASSQDELRRSKRKRPATDDDAPRSSYPRTRSQRQHVNNQPAAPPIPSSPTASHSTYSPSVSPRAAPAERPEPADGLVACPICNTRMKEALVFDHTSTCTGVPPAPVAPILAPPPPAPRPTRLPQLNYSLLRDKQLRDKLSTLGIPTWGSKPLLQRRHTEWVNLWNANCDASRPRPKAQLLADLNSWERTQGGHAPGSNGAPVVDTSVMRKDFDATGWMQKNKGDFDSLIARARSAKKTAPAPTPAPSAPPPARTPPTLQKDPQGSTASSTASRLFQSPDAIEAPVQQMFRRLSTAEATPGSPTPDTTPGFRRGSVGSGGGGAGEASPRGTSTADGSGSSNGVGNGGALGDKFGGVGGRAKKVPMFSLPAEPVVDADFGK